MKSRRQIVGLLKSSGHAQEKLHHQFTLRTLSTNVNTALDKEIQLYSTKKPTPVSLKSLMETGRGDRLAHFDEMMKGVYEKHNPPQTSQRILIQVACFLHRELPIRLAQRAAKLEASPLFLKSGM